MLSLVSKVFVCRRENLISQLLLVRNKHHVCHASMVASPQPSPSAASSSSFMSSATLPCCFCPPSSQGVQEQSSKLPWPLPCTNAQLPGQVFAEQQLAGEVANDREKMMAARHSEQNHHTPASPVPGREPFCTHVQATTHEIDGEVDRQQIDTRLQGKSPSVASMPKYSGEVDGAACRLQWGGWDGCSRFAEEVKTNSQRLTVAIANFVYILHHVHPEHRHRKLST